MVRITEIPKDPQGEDSQPKKPMDFVKHNCQIAKHPNTAADSHLMDSADKGKRYNQIATMPDNCSAIKRIKDLEIKIAHSNTAYVAREEKIRKIEERLESNTDEEKKLSLYLNLVCLNCQQYTSEMRQFMLRRSEASCRKTFNSYVKQEDPFINWVIRLAATEGTKKSLPENIPWEGFAPPLARTERPQKTDTPKNKKEDVAPPPEHLEVTPEPPMVQPPTREIVSKLQPSKVSSQKYEADPLVNPEQKRPNESSSADLPPNIEKIPPKASRGTKWKFSSFFKIFSKWKLPWNFSRNLSNHFSKERQKEKILQDTPDLSNSNRVNKDLEVPKRNDADSSLNLSKIPEGFRQIGKNLENAKVILLGEYHASSDREKILQFIADKANDGDIVLVEGKSPEDSIKYRDYKEQIPLVNAPQSMPKIKLYGWDDMEAHKETGLNIKEQFKYLKELCEIYIKGENDQLPEKVNELCKEFIKKDKDIIKVCKARDKKMLETIKYMRDKYPERKIFVIAGKKHFTGYEQSQNIESEIKDIKSAIQKNLKPVVNILPGFSSMLGQDAKDSGKRSTCESRGRRFETRGIGMFKLKFYNTRKSRRSTIHWIKNN